MYSQCNNKSHHFCERAFAMLRVEIEQSDDYENELHVRTRVFLVQILGNFFGDT